MIRSKLTSSFESSGKPPLPSYFRDECRSLFTSIRTHEVTTSSPTDSRGFELQFAVGSLQYGTRRVVYTD